MEVIDLHRRSNPDYVPSIRFRRMRADITIKDYCKGLLKEILGIRRPAGYDVTQELNPTAVKRFAEFNAMVKMSSPYSFIPDLYSRPPLYDAYISGSDQLWNPDQPYCLEPYFLTFVKDKRSLKMSYATSIGLEELRPKEIKCFKKWLDSYDVISVREQSAQMLLETITGRNISRVPDPTFLIDPEDWSDLAVNPLNDKEYILIFNLGKDENMIKAGVTIAQNMGLCLKVIDQKHSYEHYPEIHIVDDAGPLEFIGLIKNARLILTNSFHCTVFSLITGARNFYTYIPPEANRGCRIVDLLSIYGLSDHVIKSLNDIPNIKTFENLSIDRAHILDVMRKERNIGREFLASSLSVQK